MDKQNNVFQNIVSNLKGFFGGNVRSAQEKVRDVGGLFNRMGSSGTAYADTKPNPPERKLVSPLPEKPQPTIAPTITTSNARTTTGNTNDLQNVIAAGIQRFGDGTAPLATLSGELATAGRTLNEQSGVDPFLPVILALMESRGLQDPRPAANANPYNIMAPDLVDYQGNPRLAITGGVDPSGVNRLGFMGLLRPEAQGGLYGDFLRSGNLADFFTQFTPPSDPLNPSTEELISRYNSLRGLFEE